MSTHSNPFAPWVSQFGGCAGSSVNPPSAFGVLPLSPTNASFSRQAQHQNLFEFKLAPTVLSSMVSANGTHPAFKISTDDTVPGYSTVRDAKGNTVAMVEWVQNALPYVEVRGVVPKLAVRDWLHVSVDARLGRPVRKMSVKGRSFVWVPQGEQLHLYNKADPTMPCVVVDKMRHTVRVLMTNEALTFGLCEPCIIATVLLLSGRRLD